VRLNTGVSVLSVPVHLRTLLTTLAPVASPAGFEQASDIVSALLPNRRIDHGVVERKNMAVRWH
jgi:hypothetical protein